MGGSSPRAWGTPIASSTATILPRFIPTGVGNASLFALMRIAFSGSSPRAWGTPTSDDVRERQIRFIPTGVGNAPASAGRRPKKSVHPHGRGEREPCLAVPVRKRGSSPRAWGTLSRYPTRRRWSRFIPTGVGNAGFDDCRCRLQCGSSPRAWGTHLAPASRLGRCRFIPTGVGNASRHASPSPAVAVHPHGRGERVGAGVRSRRRRRFIPTGVGNAISN